MVISRIGKRGQITLPRELRAAWEVEEGDQVAFLQRGEEVVLLPLKRTLRDLRGSVPVSGPQDFEAVRQQVRTTIGASVDYAG